MADGVATLGSTGATGQRLEVRDHLAVGRIREREGQAFFGAQQRHGLQPVERARREAAEQLGIERVALQFHERQPELARERPADVFLLERHRHEGLADAQPGLALAHELSGLDLFGRDDAGVDQQAGETVARGCRVGHGRPSGFRGWRQEDGWLPVSARHAGS